jgi:hypothetical protein
MVLARASLEASSPNPELWPPDTTRPLATVTVARSTLHFRAARSIRISRAVAAALRICGQTVGVVRLPTVPMS